MLPNILGAQGVLRGRVLRDASRVPIAGAEVSLPELDRRVTTDSTGAYSFDDLSDGWLIVQTRKVGFAVRRDTINFRGRAPMVRDLTMVPQTQLDTVRTVASEKKWISPGLREFDERRKNASSGYFITDSVLRKEDGKALSSIIASRVSGMRLVPGRMGSLYMLSSRKPCKGPTFGGCLNPDCFVTVYLNGVLHFSATSKAPPPDAAQFKVDELAGVEFYANSATGPVQYNATDSGCGTLLLWTRER